MSIDRVEKKREILQCPNYKYFAKSPSLFDPAVFDIQTVQSRLSEALSGPTARFEKVFNADDARRRNRT